MRRRHVAWEGEQQGCFEGGMAWEMRARTVAARAMVLGFGVDSGGRERGTCRVRGYSEIKAMPPQGRFMGVIPNIYAGGSRPACQAEFRENRAFPEASWRAHDGGHRR